MDGDRRNMQQASLKLHGKDGLPLSHSSDVATSPLDSIANDDGCDVSLKRNLSDTGKREDSDCDFDFVVEIDSDPATAGHVQGTNQFCEGEACYSPAYTHGRNTPPSLDADDETLSDISLCDTQEDDLSNGTNTSESSFGLHNAAYPSNLHDGDIIRQPNSLRALSDPATSASQPVARFHGRERSGDAAISVVDNNMLYALDSCDLSALNDSVISFQDAGAAPVEVKQESFALQAWLTGNDDPWSPLNASHRRW